MAVNNKKKGMIVALVLVGFIGLVFGFYQFQSRQHSASIPATPDTPAYQTGKAFEVIEPNEPAGYTSDKSPETLISEADDIIARANAILEKNNLGGLEMSDEQKQATAEKVADIEQKIVELEAKLEP